MEVIYKHCSALIAIAEFNIKMYRSHLNTYQEEWQRRKSRRVDSLFLDLPILSPVPEESRELTDKSQIVPHDDASDDSTRSYSPLPSLIIEILPDKHDEPEEYYVKLQKRMMKAYRRLLVENGSLSSGVFESMSNLNTSSSVSDDDRDLDDNNFDNDSESYDSYYSDMSGDDSQSINRETIESTMSDTDRGRGIDCEMSGPDDEEANESLTSTDTVHSEELHFEDLLNPNFGQIQRLYNRSIQKDVHNTRIDNNDITNDTSSNDFNETHKNNDYEDTGADKSNNASKIEVIDVDNGIEMQQKHSEVTGHDEENWNVVDLTTDDSETTEISSAGTDYRQITTTAIVHVDGCRYQDCKESTVYEDSIKSVILPTRAVVRSATQGDKMQVELEDIAGVEDHEDPPTLSPDLPCETESTIEDIEQMRSGQADLSQESIPLTHFDSETHQLTASREGLVNTTPSPQNGGVKDNTEFRISNDMSEVLSYDFNEKQTKNYNNLRHSRKRKASGTENKSIQTCEIISWNNYDGEIILSGAKVFRLCACKDHVCR